MHIRVYIHIYVKNEKRVGLLKETSRELGKQCMIKESHLTYLLQAFRSTAVLVHEGKLHKRFNTVDVVVFFSRLS